MNIILILVYIVLGFVVFFLIFTYILQLYFNHSEKVYKEKTDFYNKILVEYSFLQNQEEKNKFIRKNKLKQLVRNNDAVLINTFINHLNSFTGSYRKNLISLIDEIGLTDLVINKLDSAKLNMNRRLYLYQLGEFRSKSKINEYLQMNFENDDSINIIIGYFFLITTTVNEWIEYLDKETIKNCLKKLVEIIEVIQDSEKWNLKRIMDYFLNSTRTFFNHILKDTDTKEYFINKIYNSNLKLEARGLLLYIMSLHREYSIADKIIEDFFYYIDVKDKNNEEFEFIINLVRAAGELNIDSTKEILLRAAQDESWILRAVSAKYLGNTDNSNDILNNLLTDQNWWVRVNSANSLKNTGMTGIKTLINAVDSNDKYAREVAAHTLADTDYINEIIDSEFNNFIQYNDLITSIIKNGNNTRLIENIIERDFSFDYKKEFLDMVLNENTMNLIENSINHKHYDENIKNYFIEKSKEIKENVK